MLRKKLILSEREFESGAQLVKNYKSVIPQVHSIKPWQDVCQIETAFLNSTLKTLYSRSQFFSFALLMLKSALLKKHNYQQKQTLKNSWLIFPAITQN